MSKTQSEFDCDDFRLEGQSTEKQDHLDGKGSVEKPFNGRGYLGDGGSDERFVPSHVL